MTTTEFLGVWLGLIVACAAALFIRIGYETAKQRRWRMTLVYLRLGGVLSLTVWLVMLAVLLLFHDGHNGDSAAMRASATEVMTQRHGASGMDITLPSGAVVSWSRPAVGAPVWQIRKGI